MNFVVKVSGLDGGQIILELRLVFRTQRIPFFNQLSILGFRQGPLFSARAYLSLKIQNDRLEGLDKRVFSRATFIAWSRYFIAWS